jgi:hypothetical protein
MKPKVTAKDFFYWAGAMVAFYWSVIAFIFLFFSYVDYAFPNILGYRGNPYEGSMPYEMASIIVVLPMFILLMWLVRRDIAAEREKGNLWVRRWAIIFTLFIAGLTAVIDLVTLLTTFFRGEELTTGFLLKVLVVLFVSAIVFMHFIADLWGYWEKFPERNRYVAYAVGLLALVSVFSGFFIVGTPWQARLARVDDQRVNDLQQIQSQVISYYQTTGKLPAALSDLQDSINGFVIPKDPVSRSGYEYHIMTTNQPSFELCADFKTANLNPDTSYPSRPMAAPGYSGSDIWPHNATRTCFVRIINPDLYPRISTNGAPPKGVPVPPPTI